MESILVVGKVLLGKELKRKSVKELVMDLMGKMVLVLCVGGETFQEMHDRALVCAGVRG